MLTRKYVKIYYNIHRLHINKEQDLWMLFKAFILANFIEEVSL